MPATDTPDFAHQLRRYRRRRRLTQEELAERAGISAAAVSLLERALTQAPQKTTARLLSAALELSPDESALFLAAARRKPASDGVTGDIGSDVPPASAAAPRDEIVPVPLTSLLGREHDVGALLELLGHPATRLLTLCGPAGVGKTRLALHLAATLRRERGQDVAFVWLISVQEPERVLPAIAQALGMRDSGMLPLRDSLVRALRDRPLMLVLDNFEQVLPAARAVLELLVACPQVKALVTSRSALNVRGERCYPVSPLALPDPTQMRSLDDLCAVPTVALFVERARAVQPDFAFATREDGHLVAGICARLDGLPLAIELAAARVRHFSLRQLYDRLAQPAFLGLLGEGPQDLADHQRTMRSTIAWSYDLLAPREQRLFRWLGVFVGGATLDAIAAVVGVTDDALLGSLATLVDASLLECVDAAGTRRYSQLVTLRAYAQERLRVAGEWDEARQRHADYFLQVAELISPHRVDQLEGVMALVLSEYENMRAALTWALESDATRHGLRMVGALWRFWFTHSFHPLEGLDWLERFIARAGTPTTDEERSALAQAWMGVVAISHRLDRFERARQAAETLLELRREIGDKIQIAYALNALANPISQLHDYARAAALYEEALALHREANNRGGMIVPLQNLGELHYEMGRPYEALAYYEQCLSLSREVGESELARAAVWIGVADVYIDLDEALRAVEVAEPRFPLFVRHHDTFGIAVGAFTLGRAHWRLGEAQVARAYLDEAQRLYRSLGNPVMAARILYVRASLAVEQGDIAAAQCDLAQAVADLGGHSRQSEYLWWIAERAGTLACRCGAYERAARLYGAAMAHRDATPRPIEPAERELRARDLEALSSALGEDEMAHHLAEGQMLSWEDALTLIHQELQ